MTATSRNRLRDRSLSSGAHAERDFEWILAQAARLRDAALGALTGDGPGQTPVNTVAGERQEVAEAPDGELIWVECPSYGAGIIAEAPDRVSVVEYGDRVVLENAALRATLGAGGELESLVEKSSGREALDEPGNRFELYDDRPTAFDAWDIDPFHLETGRSCAPAESRRVTLDGPLRAEVVFERRFGAGSSARQTVRLEAGARRLELHTDIDWHEDHRLLKVAFPTVVRARDATYEMQFGVAERPTHYSTSHDLARFEVPGHRFADLSQHGFGVTLLSRSTYGWSTFGGTMRLSLLRAPTSPDPRADRGRHTIDYAVMPHAGGWREAGVAAEARRFNVPVVWAPGRIQPGSLASVDDENLVLDTIKRAEDSDALVLRLYDAYGARGTARLRLGFAFENATFCNLLEDEIAPAVVAGREIELPYRPFEILTLKVC